MGQISPIGRGKVNVGTKWVNEGGPRPEEQNAQPATPQATTPPPVTQIVDPPRTSKK